MLRLLLLIAVPFVVDAAVAYALAATPEDRPVQASIVFFDWDQPDLSVHARAILADAGSAAASGHATQVVLLAADGMGRATAYGAALSAARWRNLMQDLAQDGVSPSQIVRSGLNSFTLRPPGVTMTAAR